MAEHHRLFDGEYRKVLSVGRRLLAWLLPPLALILGPAALRSTDRPGKNGPGQKTAGIILLVITLITLRGELARAQDAPASPVLAGRSDALYGSAVAAQRAENWERAIELFSAGSKTYPDDFRFPWSLGNLYYRQRLYRLAWDEYRLAEKITQDGKSDYPQAADLLFQLANTAGYLNRNDVSADYLEKLIVLEPDNREAIGSLAWMYFKLHRLPEGERLLLDAEERLGPDADFSMTLGTIYSDMFMYQEAKDAYLKAIKGAEATGFRLSSALAYYNLSILESRFYRFSLAYDSTNASLEAMNRASGRLARGELFMRRMELPHALAEYEDAYGMDSSPLSKLNLAQIYQAGGRLTEARLYAEDCLKATDLSWMLNYGIDPNRYRRDIHEVLKDTYEGLFRAEDFSAPGTLKESIQSLFRKISYGFRWKVHEHLFHKYSLLSADAYRSNNSNRSIASGGDENTAGEIHLEALTLYFKAFEAYPRRSLAYLRQARDFEEPLIPASAPSYDYEEGKLLKNRELLSPLPGEFDPLWERDMITDTYRELALRGKKTEQQDAAERLFALNRGALLQNGIRLPVVLRLTGEASRIASLLGRAVRNAGLDPVRLTGSSGSSPRYTLTLGSSGDGAVSCELYDGGRGIAIFRKNLPLPSSSGPQRAAFARGLRDGIFAGF